MAEIVKQGSRPSGWNKVAKCTGNAGTDGGTGCRAKIRVFAEDVYRRAYSDGEGGHDYENAFCCPECGSETLIDGPRNGAVGKEPDYRELAERRKKWNEQFRKRVG